MMKDVVSKSEELWFIINNRTFTLEILFFTYKILFLRLNE